MCDFQSFRFAVSPQSADEPAEKEVEKFGLLEKEFLRYPSTASHEWEIREPGMSSKRNQGTQFLIARERVPSFVKSFHSRKNGSAFVRFACGQVIKMMPSIRIESHR
jgi:hypothetical protein